MSYRSVCVVSCVLAAGSAIGQGCQPTQIGFASPTDRPKAVAKVGDLLYVASNVGDVQVVNVADPMNPFITGVAGPQPGFALGIEVFEGRAFVTTYVDDFFHIYDLTDPTGPLLVRGDALPGDGLSADIWKPSILTSTTYAAVGVNGSVRIYDVTPTLSFPFQINPIATFNTTTSASDVLRNGDYLYVANSTLGLRVVNIANPTQPLFVNLLPTGGIAEGLDLDDDRLYVADGSGGLRIYDVSVASNPVLLGVEDTPGIPVKVDVVGDRAYLASSEGDLEVVDVSDPTSPEMIGSLNLPGNTLDVVVEDGIGYLAQDQSKIRIVDLSDCADACLADVNMNGLVEPTDFGAWLAAYNADDPAADQNGDGQITPTDFGAWLSNYNAGCD